ADARVHTGRRGLGRLTHGTTFLKGLRLQPTAQSSTCKASLPKLIDQPAAGHAITRRPGYEPPWCVIEQHISAICPVPPDQGKCSARKAMRARVCVPGVRGTYSAHKVLRAKLCATLRAASRRRRRE